MSVAYSPKSRSERHLRTLMTWWTFLFLAAGILFAVYPNGMIQYVNQFSTSVLGWKKTLPVSPSHFWHILALAYMALLALMSLKVTLHPKKHINLVPIIIFSKLFTMAGFLLAYFFSLPCFIYLLGAVVDSVIMLITWFYYSQAMQHHY